MLTEKEAKKLNGLIHKLIQAEVTDSWKGGGDPQDIPIIEAELKIARLQVKKYLQELQTLSHKKQ